MCVRLGWWNFGHMFRNLRNKTTNKALNLIVFSGNSEVCSAQSLVMNPVTCNVNDIETSKNVKQGICQTFSIEEGKYAIETMAGSGDIHKSIHMNDANMSTHQVKQSGFD